MTKKADPNKWPEAVYLLIVGLGVGWLTGLSTSPVIAGVLSSIMGIAGGVVVGLRSIGKDSSSTDVGNNEKSQVSALPAALLVIGIALAAPLGILARTYHVFEPPAVRQAISEQIRKTGKAGQQDRGVLFSATSAECAELSALAGSSNEAAFRAVLANSGLTWAVKLEAGLADTAALKQAVRSLCANE
jgi:hypothetical protein